MTAFLEPRDGILIARAGEEIVCPECGSAVVKFERDFTSSANLREVGFLMPCAAVTPDPLGTDKAVVQCRCGGMPSSADASPGERHDPDLLDAVAPRLFIRSGSWVGWRGLGE